MTQNKQNLVSDSEIVQIEPPAEHEISKDIKCFSKVLDVLPINNIVSSLVEVDSKRSH